MRDLWMKAADGAVLARFCAGYENVLGPAQGRATALEEGGVSLSGDPDFHYACVRSDESIDLPVGIAEIPPDEGEEVLGVWA